MKNETPNERNHRLLKQRFENEKGNENGNGIVIRNELGNETRIGNENRNENENETGNELHFRNELQFEIEPRNETITDTESIIKNKIQKQLEHNNNPTNNLVNSMKTEILFFDKIPNDFLISDITTKSSEDLIQIVIVNKGNINDLYQKYHHILQYYLNRRYLTESEVTDFKLCTERYNLLRKIDSYYRIDEKLDKLDEELTISTNWNLGEKLKQLFHVK